jgi:hypothetical protein
MDFREPGRQTDTNWLLWATPDHMLWHKWSVVTELNLTTNWCLVCNIHSFSAGSSTYWRNSGRWHFCFCREFRFRRFKIWKTKCNICKVLLVATLSTPQHCWMQQGKFSVDVVVRALRCSSAGLSNVVPAIYFPGALFYSAGFNVSQNFKKKIFLNNSMFKFFS